MSANRLALHILFLSIFGWNSVGRWSKYLLQKLFGGRINMYPKSSPKWGQNRPSYSGGIFWVTPSNLTGFIACIFPTEALEIATHMPPKIFGLTLYMPSDLEPHYGRQGHHILRKFSMWYIKIAPHIPTEFSPCLQGFPPFHVYLGCIFFGR